MMLSKLGRWVFLAAAVVVAISADGGRLAAACLGVDNQVGSEATEPPTIFVWDRAGGPPIARLTGHREPVTAIVLSPDGRTLVSGDLGYDLRVWDVATSQERGRLARAGSVAMSMAFAPVGNTLAVTTGDGVFVWDVGGAEPKRSATLETPRGKRSDDNDRTLSVAFSPDGERLAAVTLSWLYVWDVEGTEFTRRRRAKEPNEGNFSCAGFLHDGKRAVTCDSNGTNFVVWDLDGDEPKPLNGVPRVDAPSAPEPTTLAGLADGRLLVAEHRVVKSEPFNVDGVARPPVLRGEGSVVLRDIRADKVVATFIACDGAAARDGKTIVTTGDSADGPRPGVRLQVLSNPREDRVFLPPAAK